MSEPTRRARNSLPPPLPVRQRGWRRFPPNLRTFRSRLANDLLGWEVLRAGRRTGTLAVARTAISGLLLAAMWALWAAQFPGDASLGGTGTEIGKNLTSFAESFAVTFFIVQATAVLLLTPVFVAGAIFEERDTRSGEILLTTELTRREVYVGKVGARMVQVLLVILASMPILFLTQLWGGRVVGDDPRQLLGHLHRGDRGRRGYGRTQCLCGDRACRNSSFVWLVASVVRGIFSGIAIPDHLDIQLSLGPRPGLHGPLSAVATYHRAHWLLYWPALAAHGHAASKNACDEKKAGSPPPLPSEIARRLPPLHDDADPLLWKELNVGTRVTPREALKAWTKFPGKSTIDDRMDKMGGVRWLMLSRETSAFVYRLMIALIGVALFLLAVTNMIPNDWIARVLGVMAVAWLLCAVGISAASGISRERQKQSLIFMLMLPGPRRDLLKAKALGALSRGIWPAICSALLLMTAVIGLRLSLIAVVCLAFTAAGLTVFSVAIGIWLSARCCTALNATAIWIGTLSALIIGTFLLAEANVDFVRNEGARQREDYPAWSRVLNPLLAWGRLCFRYDYRQGRYTVDPSPDSWAITIHDVIPSLLCSVLFATIGYLLWLLAVRRFEKEGRA